MNTKQVQMNMSPAFEGKLTQGMDGNRYRRDIWQRVWAPLNCCVSIGPGVLCRHEMKSKEYVSCV